VRACPGPGLSRPDKPKSPVLGEAIPPAARQTTKEQ
jgi:hypothetical protein